MPPRCCRRRAISIRTRPEAFIALANAYLLRDDQARAEQLFQRARDAAPDSPSPLLAWADALAGRR